MGVGQENVYALGATQFNLNILGASQFPTLVQPPAGCVGWDVAYISGGSVHILPANISGGSIGGATAAVKGWPLTATPYSVQGPAAAYLAWAGSSLATVAVNFKFSSGGASLV